MRKFLLIALFTASLATVGACGDSNGVYNGKEVASTTGSTHEMENKFDAVHKVTVTVPEGARKIRAWLPVPQDDEYQTISNFELTDKPGDTKIETEKTDGNKFAYCEINNPTEKSYTLGYKFTIARKRQSNLPAELNEIKSVPDEDRALYKKFLGEHNYVPVNADMKKLADEIAGDETNPAKMARKFYDWIIQKGEYWKKDKTKYAASGHGSTAYFLEKCTGNCTDFHAIFMSLMRAKGVPVRMWFGGVFWTDKEGKDEDLGYHCWPEFYAPGVGWVVIDASQADVEADKTDFYFGNIESRRITFCLGRDINLAPRQDGGPLEMLGTTYVEVDGKPFADKEKVVRKFTFGPAK